MEQKAHRLLLFIALTTTISPLLSAQETEIPYVYSPNAAELGKYGQVPVDYYNGLPSIKIPLTELRAKGYTLPVYLTYHARGNKPDQHPGWSGLGWTLHAGGCINRITNGYPDECSRDEFLQYGINPHPYAIVPGTSISNATPGYLSKASDLQNDIWAFSADTLAWGYFLHDTEPDEFQVNIDDIQASFFFIGEGQVKIKSKSPVDFKVEYRLSGYETVPMYNPVLAYTQDTLRTCIYSHIREFILTTSGGIKYYFGGDLSAIEFSATRVAAPDGYWKHLHASVNTWNLSKIKFPNGEEVTFTYKHDGIPIVKTSQYATSSVTYGVSTDQYGSSNDERFYEKYIFLFPAYLTQITAKLSGETLTFSSSHSTELSYGLEEVPMSLKLGPFSENHPFSQFTAKDYYLKVDNITGRREKINFNYSSSTSRRLRLNSINLRTTQDVSVGSYAFSYDPTCLPQYNSKLTDKWGYYNGIQYNMMNPESYNTVRVVNFSNTKAEILRRITYPTGGYTDFEYEQNMYSGYIDDIDRTRRISYGVAGGLRIKSITDSDGTTSNKRTFSYTRDNGVASGTLSGIPRFSVTGKFIFDETLYSSYTKPSESRNWFHSLWNNLLSLDDDGLGEYSISNERSLNYLSKTDGSDISYDSVLETRSDGAAVRYDYYSYYDTPDEAPVLMAGNYNNLGLTVKFTNSELSRGLLKRLRLYSTNGFLCRDETYEYNRDTSSYVKAVAHVNHCHYWLRRLFYYKNYTYFPYLSKKTIKSYPDSGYVHTESWHYTYDQSRNLTSIRQNVLFGDSIEKKMSYVAGMARSGIYAEMKDSNMLNYPVEYLKLKNGYIIEAELLKYKKTTDGMYVPGERFIGAMGSGVAESSFNKFIGLGFKDSRYGIPQMIYDTYDSHGNPRTILSRTGIPISLFWDKNGVHLTARMNGADKDSYYFDFEENDNHSYGTGFQSDKGWVSNFTKMVNVKAGGQYILDWKRRVAGIWKYESTAVTPTDTVFQITVSASSTTPIDNVRLYPASALPENYTWTWNGLLRSITNSRGVSESYSYDGFGRLLSVYDNNNHLVRSYSYQYAVGNNRIITDEFTSISGISANRTVEHYDGLGRKIQTVRRAGIIDALDLVDHVQYDSLGREYRRWLTCNGNAYSGGKLSLNQVSSNAQSIYSDTRPFTEIEYDGSPLDRKKLLRNPGVSWYYSDKAIRTTRLTNSSSLAPLIHSFFSVSFAGTLIFLQKNSTAYSGVYHVIKTEDEDGNESYVFQDIDGKTVREVKVLTENGDKQYLTTVYVYDRAGRLTGVLPPLLVESLSGTSWNSSSTALLNQYGYFYQYDSRGRMFGKKLPGADWIFYVYDGEDRPVFTQNGIQRASGLWSYAISDIHGRICLEGQCSNSFAFYNIPLGDIAVTAEKTPVFGNGQYYGYNINGVTLESPSVNSVFWYDNYSFLGEGTVPDSLSASVRAENPPSSDYGTIYEGGSRGILTGSLSKILTPENIIHQDSLLWTVSYYDDHAREVQVCKATLNGGHERSFSGYNFIGCPVVNKISHCDSSNVVLDEFYVYTYDSWGNPKKTTHRVGENGREVVLSELTYDYGGRIKRDKRNGDTDLDIHYQYNVRSQLTNQYVGNYIEQVNIGTTFYQSLYYNNVPVNGSSTPCWGGNISREIWSCGGVGTHRYDYSYDELSRLVSARYGDEQSDSLHFGRIYIYDHHGNPTRVGSHYYSGASYSIYHNWEYSHTGNQPSYATETYTSVYPQSRRHLSNDIEEGTTGGRSIVTPRYYYDTNGRLESITGQRIATFSYNVLDKLSAIADNNSTQIASYDYLSDGTKVRMRKMSLAGVYDETTYVGNLIYRNGTLDKILFDGGYVSAQDTLYHFFTFDHRGNIRVVSNESGNVEQINHYDPFGLVIRGSTTSSSDNKYLFSGKEWDDLAEAYDFHARLHDPILCRFTIQDPLAEEHYGISPYVFCNDNPINFVDFDGLDWYTVDINGKVVKVKDVPVDEEQYDRLFPFVEYGPLNMNDYISIKDREILPALVKTNEKGISRTNLSYNDRELQSLFFYLSDHSNVEWGLYTSKEGSSLGTAHKTQGTGVKGWGNYVPSKPISKIHSHPNTGTSDKAEYESMGYFFNDNAFDSNSNLESWDYKKLSGSAGDWSNFINDYELNNKRPSISKVYFPGSGKIYTLRYNTKPHITYKTK